MSKSKTIKQKDLEEAIGTSKGEAMTDQIIINFLELYTNTNETKIGENI